MQSAETANEKPSKMKAHPVPSTSSSPPINGPTACIASGRTTWATEFASTRTSSETIDGMIEENAGAKRA